MLAMEGAGLKASPVGKCHGRIVRCCDALVRWGESLLSGNRVEDSAGNRLQCAWLITGAKSKNAGSSVPSYFSPSACELAVLYDMIPPIRIRAKAFLLQCHEIVALKRYRGATSGQKNNLLNAV